jgi:MFS family permease
VIVAGPHCTYDPFTANQTDECARLLDHLSKLGVSYKRAKAPAVVVTIGGQMVPQNDPAVVEAALKEAGYRFDRIVPAPLDIAMILVAMTVLMALCGATYGPVAALLSEMFPSRIRYSSMSIPYHIGTGYFGGFLPFISQYIVARTGNPYAGLWYTFGVVAMAMLVTMLGLRETVALRGQRR